MNIVYASDDFQSKFSEEEKQGEIHSVFRHVVNLKMDARIYTIGDASVPIGPCTAVLDVGTNFESWELEKGSRVEYEPETGLIHLGDWNREIINRPENVWKSGFDPRFNRLDQSELEKNLENALEIIGSRGDRDSLAPLIAGLEPKLPWLVKTNIDLNFEHSSRWDFISDRMLSFLKAVERREWERIPDETQSVIGFGPGLTPSSDDLVVGLIAGLLYSEADSESLLKQLHRFIRNLEGRTTDISYEALYHASRGKFNSLLKRAALAIVSDGDMSAVENLLRIGQTSGTDLAVGLYFGMKINQCKGEQ